MSAQDTRSPADLAPGEVRPHRALSAADERYCEQSVPAAFAAQAARTPRAAALASDAGSMTYEELDRASNRIAAGIRAELGAAGERVGILLRDDAGFVAALLGVLKAGNAAVPLDPRHPASVLTDVVRDCGARLLVVEDDRAWGAPPVPARALGAYDREDAAPLDVPVGPDAVALLLYTSGSTGEPRGICRPHRAVLNHALVTIDQYEIGEGTRVGQLLSPAFGTAHGLGFGALLTGATIVRFDVGERGIVGLPGWLGRHGVEVVSVVPSMLDPLVAAAVGLPSLRRLSVGGERLSRASAESARRLLPPGGRLVQTYGSTEAARICVHVFEGPVEPGEDPLPVGLACAGKRVRVVAADGSPAAPGMPGEILVTSRYLGYRWRCEADGAGSPQAAADRTIRTGDHGFVDSDGRLVLVGREDRMVKIRGQRVELDAVERALRRLAPVAEAAVVDEPAGRSARRLVAYVVLQRAATERIVADLRHALRSSLPRSMVPSRIVVLDALPLLPNGKLDLRGLSAADASGALGRRPPAGADTEARVIELWAAALEVESVGREDDFFELGGDSLVAAVIAAALHAAFGVELELRAFAEGSTPAAMAGLVERLRAEADAVDDPPLVRVSRAGPLPLSFAQERTWGFSRTAEASSAYVMARRSRIRGPLDVSALRAAVAGIVERHEILRTTFAQSAGRPVQVVHPPADVDVPLIDLRGAPDPAGDATATLTELAHRPFDLERGPLVRFALVRTGGDEHQLLRAHHHVISDGWSWRVFFDELAALYEAHRRGEPSPLPPLPVQYADFAAWERRRLEPGTARYRRQQAAWRRVLAPPHPPLELPFTRPRPREDAHAADGVMWWGLEPGDSSALDRRAAEAGATYYMSRLAIFAAQLAIETDRDDIVVGAYVTNRRRAELQQLFGLFSNLTTLRLRFREDLTLRGWLGRVRDVVIETGGRAEVPYHQVVEELGRAGVAVPEIRAVFGMTDQLPRIAFGGLEVVPLKPLFTVMPWQFSFMVDRSYESHGCAAAFDARIHDPSGVRGFVERYRGLLRSACAHPDRPLAELHVTRE